VDTQVPQFDGVHHLKLPVSDLDHPEGGPRLALRPDPGKAATASGFDYFSIGVPTKAAMDALSARLTQLGGTPHAGVQVVSLGWILPGLLDPDGHEICFFTTESTKKRPTGRSKLWRMPGGRLRTAIRNRCHGDQSTWPPWAHDAFLFLKPNQRVGRWWRSVREMLTAATRTPVTTPSKVSATRVMAAAGPRWLPSPVMINAMGVTAMVVNV